MSSIDVLLADFQDLPDLARVIQLILRLFVAAALGGALGFERQMKGKAAGLRTHMLVALGAALFVIIPQQAGMPIENMGHVFQGVTTGIGFLGAGSILKSADDGQIKGLTTAASIWLTAAAGLAAGLGRLASAVIGVTFALIILSLARRITERAELA